MVMGDCLRGNDRNDPERSPFGLRRTAHWLLPSSSLACISTLPPSSRVRCTLAATSATWICGIHWSGRCAYSALRAPRPMMGMPRLFNSPTSRQSGLSPVVSTRVEANLALVFGNRDVGAEDGADAWDKVVGHTITPLATKLADACRGLSRGPAAPRAQHLGPNALRQPRICDRVDARPEEEYAPPN